MDGPAALLVVCASAATLWIALVLSLLVGGLRRRRVAVAPASSTDPSEWQAPAETLERVGISDASGDDSRVVLVKALRSDEPELRMAAITALGRLGGRHEWAIDGLVEALVQERDDIVKVATQLDRLAPRPGPRLPPLLAHPSSVVRFYAVRLLAGYEHLAAQHVPPLTSDRSPNVRAAALETLRAVASGETLRCALRMLEDPNPLVRAHASRTASTIAPGAAAPYLVPLLADSSWWVRDAAREGLVAAGHDVAATLGPALESPDPTLRSGAALVLQDVGLVDELAGGDDQKQLERVLDAGGRRLRQAAADRARLRLRLGAEDTLVESA